MFLRSSRSSPPGSLRRATLRSNSPRSAKTLSHVIAGSSSSCGYFQAPAHDLALDHRRRIWGSEESTRLIRHCSKVDAISALMNSINNCVPVHVLILFLSGLIIVMPLLASRLRVTCHCSKRALIAYERARGGSKSVTRRISGVEKLSEEVFAGSYRLKPHRGHGARNGSIHYEMSGVSRW